MPVLRSKHLIDDLHNYANVDYLYNLIPKPLEEDDESAAEIVTTVASDAVNLLIADGSNTNAQLYNDFINLLDLSRQNINELVDANPIFNQMLRKIYTIVQTLRSNIPQREGFLSL